MEVSPTWVRGFEAAVKGEKERKGKDESYRKGYQMGKVAQDPDRVVQWIDQKCKDQCDEKDTQCVEVCKSSLLNILYFAVHIIAHPNQPHYQQVLATVAKQMDHWKKANGYNGGGGVDLTKLISLSKGGVPKMDAKSFFEWTKNLGIPILQQYLEEQGLIGPHAPVDLQEILTIMTSKEADLAARERADRMLKHLQPFIRDRLMELKS